jgi:hypothetical protein
MNAANIKVIMLRRKRRKSNRRSAR